MLSNMIFDRTANDVAQKTDKGLYRYTDLNRVTYAITDIYSRFVSFGYKPRGYRLPLNWQENDIIRVNAMTDYLNSVRGFIGIIPLSEPHNLPTSMNGLDYKGANAIEKFLFNNDEMLDNIESTWWYSNELFSDEVDM